MHLEDEVGMQLLDERRYVEATRHFESKVVRDASDWSSLYHLGFCWRARGDFAKAKYCYEQALSVKSDVAHVHLGLGVVLQQQGQLESAIASMTRAVQLNPLYDTAHNSLGLTYKMAGLHAEAATAYENCIKAIAQNVANSLPNDRSAPIYPPFDTRSTMWLEVACWAMLQKSREDPSITRVAWPTRESAATEEGTHANGGLIYLDQRELGAVTRVFLPNFFNATYGQLLVNGLYYIVRNNLGMIHLQLGSTSEAKENFFESICFIPPGVIYDSPYFGLREAEGLH